MASSQRGMRVVFRLGMLLVLLGVLTGGGYAWHKVHRQSAARDALQTGRAALAAKEYTKAATDLGRYLTVDPRNVDVLLDYADAQIRRRPQPKGSFQQAVNALEIVLRDHPAHEVAAERLCELYMMAETPGDAERIAEAWLEAADATSQTSAQKQLLAALLAQEKFDDAAKVADDLYSEAPDDPAARLAPTDVLIARGKPAEAIPLLRTILEQQPDSLPAATRLAALIASEAKAVADAPKARSEAEQILSDLITRTPESVDARMARGRFYLQLLNRRLGAQQEDRARAIEDFEAAAKLPAADTDTFLEVGVAYSQLGEREKAAEAFETARQREPDRLAVYTFQGQMALDRGDVEGGVRVADAVMAAPLGESQFDLLPLVAELYAVAKQAPQARKCIDELRAASMPPEMLIYLEALVQLAEGKTDDALAGLQDVNRRAPSLARPYLVLARILQASPDARLAVEPLRQYIRLEREAGRAAPAILAQVELARLLERLGQWNELATVATEIPPYLPDPSIGNLAFISRVELLARAARMRPEGRDLDQLKKLEATARELVEASPQTTQFQILLARIVAWQGRVDEADALLDGLEACDTDPVVCAAARVEMYADAGQFDRAVTACQRLLELTDEADRPPVSSRLAELFASAGDMDKAAELLEARAANTTAASRAQVYVELARLCLQHDQRERAQTLLVQAIQEDPASREAHLLLLRAGSPSGTSPTRSELIAGLKRIEGEDGWQWKLWQAIAFIEQEGLTQPDARKAESLLNECIEHDPSWSDAGIALARLHEKTGNDDAAMAACRRVLDRDPNNLRAIKLLLYAAQRLQRWYEVDRLLDQLPPDDPDTGPFRLSQALRSGDAGLAISLLEKRVAETPDDFLAQLQLSSIARASNNLAEAERRLAEAMKIAPDAPEVLAARVQIHIQKSEFEQALRLCDAALEKATTADAYQLRAGVHEAKGDVGKAADDLRSVAQLEGSAERGFLALGRLYFRRNDVDSAVASWREGLQVVPESYPMRGALAGALLASTGDDQREEGAAILTRLLSERPDDLTLQLMDAERIAQAAPAAAQQAFEDILRKNPRSAAAHRSLAQIAAQQGQFDRAIGLVDRGLVIDPRNFDLLLMKANLLSNTSPDRTAIAAREAMNLRPDSEEALLVWVNASARSGNIDGAMQALRQFLARPAVADSVPARLALAHLNIVKADFEAADKLIVEAERLAPETRGAVQLRLLWHHAQKNWDMLAAATADRLQKHPEDAATPQLAVQLLFEAQEIKHKEAAISILQRLIELHPKDPVHLFALGSAYYTVGKPAETAKAYEQGLDLDPKRPNILNDLTWIICEDLKDPNEALKWGEKARAAAPDDGHVLDTWGVLQYRLGNLEASCAALRKCREIENLPRPTFFSATFHLARSLATIDRSESRRLLEQLLENPEAKKLLSQAVLDEADDLLKSLQAADPATSQLPETPAAAVIGS